MSTEVGKLHYDLSVDDSGLKQGLDGADKQIEGFGSKLDSFGDKMTNAGKKMTVGLTLPIIGMAGFAVKAFSDLGEAVNAASVTFGDSSKALQDFAETASKQVGLSKRAFLEASVPIGAALQNVGYTADEAANSSVELTKRAADMASVFNVDVSEALTAIGAGLRGESEPLKRFGVGLDEASIKAYALAKGITKEGEEMTNSEKVRARYGLLMEQSNKVAGDFVNTSDSIANSQRILKADTENAASAFGENLAPAMSKLQAEGAKLLESFNKLTPAQQELVIKGAGVLAMVGPLTTAFGALFKVLAVAPAVVGGVGTALALFGPQMLQVYNITKVVKMGTDDAKNSLSNMGFSMDQITAKAGTLQFSEQMLAQSTNLVKTEQDKLKLSTDLLASAQLGLEGANLRAETAQQSYNEAVKKYGPDSLEARKANHELKSAQQGVKDAADAARRAQEEKSKSESELAKKKDIDESLRRTTEELKNQTSWWDRLGKRAEDAGIKASLYGGFKKIPGFATGVKNFQGGMAIVGEKGPELVNLPRGSDVIPNDNIRDIGKKASNITPNVSTSSGSNITINLSGIMTESREGTRQVARSLVNALNEQLRASNKQEIPL